MLDRFAAKPILIAANIASAFGYAGLAFVDRPWEAFACAVIGGAGVGVTRVANQTLLITLTTPEQRVASFALGRAAQNLGLGLGAAVAGFVLSAAQDLRSPLPVSVLQRRKATQRPAAWTGCRGGAVCGR